MHLRRCRDASATAVGGVLRHFFRSVTSSSSQCCLFSSSSTSSPPTVPPLPDPLDAFVDRRNTGSRKWDEFDAAVPMWVADMDFRCPRPVLDAVRKVVDHGIFGYSGPSEKLREGACPLRCLLSAGVHLLLATEQSVHPHVTWSLLGGEMLPALPALQHWFPGCGRATASIRCSVLPHPMRRPSRRPSSPCTR
jgi:hypothetical protein